MNGHWWSVVIGGQSQQARLGHIDVKMTTDVMSKLHAYLKVGLRSISNIKIRMTTESVFFQLEEMAMAIDITSKES